MSVKCRFCGKKIKKGENICSKCGKDINEGLGTDELIDAMPELHDEFDNISKMQAKDKRKKEKQEKRAEHKTRRIIIAVAIVVVILLGVTAGLLYYKHLENQAIEEEPIVLASSGIDSIVEKSIAPLDFTDSLVSDADAAKELLKEATSVFSIADVDKEFELEREIDVSGTKFYRFRQLYNGISVHGGTMVLMTDKNGRVMTLNGVYVPTQGLTTDYLIDAGKASAAMTEYVNRLDQYTVVEGINISDLQKAVCNSGGKTYLSYKAMVSGYNNSGKYVAYTAFIDGVNGNGICIVPASNFEKSEIITNDDIEESYIYEMSTASDKFNWNDPSLELAEETIRISDIENGNASAYISGVKNAVDSAYKYFANNFGWNSLKGNGESFKVYINSNEYVESTLPSERAMYTNNKLMFFREDLTLGDIDYNTVVHEYAHGVMQNIVGFNGTVTCTESAAIAEGLADIFGELAEASATGLAPDWIHSERMLLTPQEGYYTSVYPNIKISDTDSCYKHSTIISHIASTMASSNMSISVQSEFWFKAMCLMTSETDFKDLMNVLTITTSNMYRDRTIDDTQVDVIIAAIQNAFAPTESTSIIE